MHLKFTPKNIYLVGGSVRDYILQKSINDYDFVIKCAENKFQKEAQLFFKKNFNKKGFLIGKQFPPTLRTVINKKDYIDITLMCGTIEEDALRRDFTINALYMGLDNNEIIDPLHGKKDLEKKLIKLCSNKSFDNDPIRMLRAIRLAGQLCFKLHKKCFIEIVSKKSLIKKAAVERVRDEIEKIFINPKRYILIKWLEKTGLIFEIFPELLKIKGLAQKKFHKFDVLNHSFNILQYIPEDLNNFDKIIYCYAALFHDLGKSETNYMHTEFSAEIADNIFKRLKLPHRLHKILIELIKNHMKILQISLNNIKDKTLKKIVFEHSEIIPYMVNFARFEAKTKNIVQPEYYIVCEKLINFHREFENRKEFIFNVITGKDIIAQGVKQGEIIGKLLKNVRFHIFRDNITTKDEAFKILKMLKKQL